MCGAGWGGKAIGVAMQRTRIRKEAPKSRAEAVTVCVWAPVGGEGEAVPAQPKPKAKPDEIVFATAFPVRAPTKFAVADMRIACSGRSALVETELALEFAVSWKPLM